MSVEGMGTAENARKMNGRLDTDWFFIYYDRQNYIRLMTRELAWKRAESGLIPP